MKLEAVGVHCSILSSIVAIHMPKVDVSVDNEVMTIAPEGALDRNGIIQIVQEHYPGMGDRYVLWNLTRSDVSGLTRQDFEMIASSVAATLSTTSTRKTAYLVGNPTSYLAVWRYISEAVALRLPSEYAAFMSEAEAKRWLAKRH